jgi:putative membrane protein insertion efficiency factor
VIARLLSAVSRVLAAVLVFLVRAYQVALAPLLGGQCRYDPTCSEYAVEALDQHGAFRGAALAGRRIARCHPFRPGGFDPVPSAIVADRRGGTDGS